MDKVEVRQEDRDLLDEICGPYMAYKPKARAERLQMIARFRLRQTEVAICGTGEIQIGGPAAIAPLGLEVKNG